MWSFSANLRISANLVKRFVADTLIVTEPGARKGRKAFFFEKKEAKNFYS
jgi:hypothetical protein